MINTMEREIRGAKINPKSSFKNQDAQNTRGAEITRANTLVYLGVRSCNSNQVAVPIYGVR